VPVYLHDWFGPGRHGKVLSTAARDFPKDGLSYRKEFPVTGDESRIAEVKGIDFPKLLDPVDDLPPATVITNWTRSPGKATVRGSTTDNGTVKKVLVNGREARPLADNFAQWEIVLEVPARALTLRASAEDAAGNVEQRAHVVRLAAD